MTERPRITRRRLFAAGAGVVASAAVAGAGGATAAPSGVQTSPRSMLPEQRVGIQLYTLRDKVSSEGFAKVFERLCALGVSEVELAGYTQGSVGAITVQQIRQLLDDNGLRAIGAHAGITVANASQRLDEAQVLGMPFIGIADPASNPGARGTVAQWEASAATMNQIGELAAARGLKFYFHNHDSAFAPAADDAAKRGYEILLAKTVPGLVYFEMDILWAYVGQHVHGQAGPTLPGQPPAYAFDPVNYVLANRDRFPLFHVKDGRRVDLNRAATQGQAANYQRGYEMADVGTGHIDFASFFGKVFAAGGAGEDMRHHYLNENDNAAQHPQGSWGSVRSSIGYMRCGMGV